MTVEEGKGAAFRHLCVRGVRRVWWRRRATPRFILFDLLCLLDNSEGLFFFISLLMAYFLL
jgi:hypothetical protein